MGRSRPAKGTGYTTRTPDGRKVLTSRLLEEQIEESQRQYQELLRQNEALRAKEAEQLRCLDFYEAWVKTLGSDAAAAADAVVPADSTDSSQLSASARLDKRVQKLKQILKPQHMPGDRPLSAQDAARAHASSSSSQQTSSADSIGRGTGSLGQSSSGSQQGDAAAPSTDEKMANWFAAVTPEDLNYFRTMTAEEFAVRLRNIIGRVGLAHWAAVATHGSEADVYDALDEMGKVCAIMVMSNEQVMCKLCMMNMDTLQVEPWPEHLWHSVAAAALLQPEQSKTLAEAYRTYRKETLQLVEQQHSMMRQLQAIMGGALSTAQPPSAAAAAAAAVADDAGRAAPAHFMSLATGGAVPGEQSGEQETSDLAAALAAAVATAGSEDGSRSPARGGVQPLSVEEMAFLTEFLTDCKDRATRSAASAAGSSSTAGSSSSSWLAPAGVLALQEAEKAEQLMHGLSRIAGLMKQQLHILTICFVNLLTTAQRAEVVLAAYPFMIDLAALCGAIAAQEGSQPAGAP